ncbi:MAG: MFS transporter [Propionibacteriaceae bacterium]|nr:MFS transporter [Propionibacteriaceae bacterium]
MAKSDAHLVRVPGVNRAFDRRKILFVTLLSLSLSLIQVSSVNVAMPSINTALQAHPTDIQWVLSGYALAFGICLVPFGRLGDVIGRGSVFTIGLAVFALASLACGLATSAFALNVFRVFQGIGAGMQGPQSVGMIQQYFSGQGRARAYSLNGMVVAASVAVGPLATGLLINWLGSEIGWRMPFILNCPIGLCGCLLALRWFPFERERAHFRSGEAHFFRVDLDPLGALLLTGAVVAVMLPFMLVDAPTTRFWILAGAPVFAALWLLWEWRYGKAGREPMVDLSLLRLKSFAHQSVISAMDFLGVTSIFVIVAMFLQDGLGWTALHSSLIGLPDAVLSCLAAMWAGKRILRYRNKLIATALAFVVLGAVTTCLAVWLEMAYGISPWWMLLTLAFYGAGQGMFVSANQTLAMADVPLAMAGTAGGVKSMTERVSTAVGNAVMTGIFFSVLTFAGYHEAAMASYAAIAAIVTATLALASAYMLYETRAQR